MAVIGLNMGVIRRRILAEVLAVFAVGMLATVGLLMIVGGAQHGIRNSLPLPVTLQILPYLLPDILRLTAPACLLFAVCSTFGRMSAANEFVAIRSLGISPLRVIWPALVLAYVIGLFTFWIHDVSAWWGQPGVRQVLVQSVDDIACGVLDDSGSFSTSGISIVVKEVDNRRLISPVVRVSNLGGSGATLWAQHADIQVDRRTHVLKMVCFDGELDVPGKGRLSFADAYFIHEVPLPAVHPNEDLISPTAIRTAALARQIRRQREALRKTEASCQTPDRSGGLLAQQQIRLARLQAESHHRMANGMACFCFVLVGIPVAILARSSDLATTFFVCFAPILLVYYPLLVTGQSLIKQGILVPFAVWIANFVLVIAGGSLLYRVQTS